MVVWRFSVKFHAIYLSITVSQRDGPFFKFCMHENKNLGNSCCRHSLFSTVISVRLIAVSGHASACKPRRQRLAFFWHIRQIWCTQDLKVNLVSQSLPLTANMSMSMWIWTHKLSHAKVVAQKGAKDSTCTSQVDYVPTCLCVFEKCAPMTFGPSVAARVRVCSTTTKRTCPPQRDKTTDAPENKKKRERRQRCSRTTVCASVGMKRHARSGTWLEIHTHIRLTEKNHTPTSFTSALCGSTLETPVHQG